jgi:uroporphyrinogen decarboxylase
MALDHREPDRVPRDLGGSRSTGIHAVAYAALRRGLGLPDAPIRIGDFHQQLAEVDDDVVEALGLDVRNVGLGPSSTYRRVLVEAEDGERYTDEWGVVRRRPPGGFYFDPVTPPLAGDIDVADVDRHPFLDATDPARYAGVGERARAIASGEQRAVHVGSICSGLLETHWKLRGFEDAYLDLAADQRLARRIMERVLELKLAYWERVLPIVGDAIDIAGEGDDLGGQNGPLIAPETYRALIKPLHRELFAAIRARSRARIAFHSCGAIREFIPDLIEIGVEVLNPVQVAAAGMASEGLKRDFGRDIVFWGGGIDTQGVLQHGTPEEVRHDVERRVRDLKPGGGFIFAAIHNIQATVPAPNLTAMWEAAAASGGYGEED